MRFRESYFSLFMGVLCVVCAGVWAYIAMTWKDDAFTGTLLFIIAAWCYFHQFSVFRYWENHNEKRKQSDGPRN